MEIRRFVVQETTMAELTLLNSTTTLTFGGGDFESLSVEPLSGF